MITKVVLPIHYVQKFKTKKNKTFLVGMNWYRNAHYLITNRVKADYHLMVSKQLKNLTFGKIRLKYHVYVGRRNTDGHNIRSVIEKFFLDGMVEGSHIKDDSIDYVLGDTSEYFLDKDNPRIEIFIEEV